MGAGNASLWPLRQVVNPFDNDLLSVEYGLLYPTLHQNNIRAQIQHEKAEHERLQALIDHSQALWSESKKDLRTQAVYKLARQTTPLVLSGRTIGLFGITSSGKSSTINALIGSPVAKVGAGETTRNITAYDGQGYRLYDTPGVNDDFSYFNEEYIALTKGLTHRLVLITTTVKEMSKLLRLFDADGLHYNIVINKFDAIDVEEREDFREQILEEIEECQLKNMDHLWFVSARHPEQFHDWLAMVDYLTG